MNNFIKKSKKSIFFLKTLYMIYLSSNFKYKNYAMNINFFFHFVKQGRVLQKRKKFPKPNGSYANRL